MRSESVRFPSDGDAMLSGILRTPDPATHPHPIVVQGPGWLGVARTASYQPYHEGFCDAGYAVLVFDYRGFGDSEGSDGEIDPQRQISDWIAAIRYVRQRDDLDTDRLAVFGTGATGGGNAVVVGALERQVAAVICQVGIADGRDWLRRMRSDDEWHAFERQMEEDRIRRNAGAPGTRIRPRGDLVVVRSDDRRAAGWKSDVATDEPATVGMATADALCRYRPIDSVPLIAPRAIMFVAVDDDDVTPTDHSWALFLAASPPKKLILERNTTHYRAYGDYQDQVVPLMVEWLDRFSRDPSGGLEESVTVLDRPLSRADQP